MRRLILRLPPDGAPRRESSRGQAMAEFALVLPLLALLLVMALDFGRVFFGWVSINNAARVGAAYAAANADAWEAPTDAARQARYTALIQNDLQALNCAAAAIPDPQFTDLNSNGTADTGEPAEVALECDFDLITPLGTSVVGRVNLGGAATFPVHYTITTALPAPPPPPPPAQCTVPNTVGQSRNTARSLWTGASFQSANLIENGNGNFTVATQSVAAGAQLACSTGSMQIAEAAGPPPPPPPTCAKPTVNFTGGPNLTGKTPLTVNFTDASTTQAGCPIQTWAWTFENGSSSLQNPTQTFTNTNNGNNSAKYTITLTVTNAGGSSTLQKKDYVTVTK